MESDKPVVTGRLSSIIFEKSPTFWTAYRLHGSRQVKQLVGCFRWFLAWLTLYSVVSNDMMVGE